MFCAIVPVVNPVVSRKSSYLRRILELNGIEWFVKYTTVNILVLNYPLLSVPA